MNRLRIFREFAARGTIAATAHALGYTPSAVSQQLATLEREAGVPLVRKAGRLRVLTPAGERLAAGSDAILGSMELLTSQLRSASDEAVGTVRLAVFQSAALALLSPALNRLRESAPQVRLHVTQREPAQALEDTWARDFDLVVAEEYPHHSSPHYPGLVRETLVRDRIVAATALPAESDLRGYRTAPWVMEPVGTASRHFAEQTCRTAGFEPDVRYETADLQAHLALAEAGQAVALLPGLLLASQSITMHTQELAGDPHRTVFAARRETSLDDAAISAVLDAVRWAAEEIGTFTARGAS